MMPAGVAAVQARISGIESRFAPMDTPARSSSGPSSSQSVDFDRMLAMAQSSLTSTRGTSAASPIHAHVHSTEMGPAGAPAELAAYGNGRIPAEALVPIGQGDHRMWAPAARSFQAMSKAAALEGISFPVVDAYRSYEDQVRLAETKGIYGQGGLAAVPGTSNHGWGRSVDITTSDQRMVDWLRTHAAEYGFHEDVAGEPWHWTYRPAT